MNGPEVLDGATEREVLVDHAGMSGAGLERVRLADGRRVLVKRMSPETDLTLQLVEETVAREFLLWRDGVLDRLPDGVGHAVIGGWVEEHTTVVVMRDLGAAVLTWDDHLSAEQTTMVMERLARLHLAFLHDPPTDLAPLPRVLDAFAPHRMSPVADSGNELARLIVRGWELFGDTVDQHVAEPVLALLADAGPLATALGAGPITFLHGDLSTVNMAFEGEDLVLLDWALPVAAPGAVDVARLIAACSSVLGLGREEMLATYARAAGPACDERSMRLALLSGIMWLGWNKALDAAENPDLAVRAREQEDLDWWVAQARRTLESGAL